MNLAVAFLSGFAADGSIVIVHAAVPEQAPVHLLNDPVVADGVSVTLVFCG